MINKMAFYWKRICEYELKTTPLSLELFPFVKQLAGLIVEHLDLGPTMDRLVLYVKVTYLHKSLPKSPTLGGPKRQFKKFVLTLLNSVGII